MIGGICRVHLHSEEALLQITTKSKRNTLLAKGATYRYFPKNIGWYIQNDLEHHYSNKKPNLV